MNHLKIIIPMSLTCALAAAVNATVGRFTGFDIYGFKAWLAFPVGAMLIGLIGMSGAVLAAHYFKIKPTWADAPSILILAAATVAMIYYVDYSTLSVDEDREPSGAIGVKAYVDRILTARLGVDRNAHNARKFVEAAYDLAAIEFIGFLIGGATSLLLIGGMRKCERCDGYVRKLKTTTTPVLNFQETTELLDMFDRGDLGLLQQLVAWRPEETALQSGEQATLTYELFNCPHCKSETLIVSVRTFEGRTWKNVPALSAKRYFVADSPLRHAFP
jgi:hypothetical protein